MSRTTEARSVTVGRTATSTALTGAAGTFNRGDVGRAITGTGIPAGATITAVASGTAATLSAAATTTATGAVTVGGAGPAALVAAEQAYGFRGYSPETDAEAASYTVAANNAGTVTPDRITNTTTSAAQRRVRS